MGLFDKVKNLFTDVVEEEPIKSEVIQVEIPSPAKEIKEIKEDSIADSEAIKTEEKVSAPIFFDDEYFKELDQPKQETKYGSVGITMKELPKQKEEKKHFTPTPIISPVYGVLDKNYNKEDITTKQDYTNTKTEKITTLDEVRRKAFGSLEDELENTLFGSRSILFSEETIKETPSRVQKEDLFDELIEIDDEIKTDNIVEEEMNKNNEKEKNTSESELFDLIDSLYEKGE